MEAPLESGLRGLAEAVRCDGYRPAGTISISGDMPRTDSLYLSAPHPRFVDGRPQRIDRAFGAVDSDDNRAHFSTFFLARVSSTCSEYSRPSAGRLRSVC